MDKTFVASFLEKVIKDKALVKMDYVSKDMTVSNRMVFPKEVRGGYLFAEELHKGIRRFSLEGIMRLEVVKKGKTYGNHQ